MMHKNLHSGRRARMREKFREHGKSAFHPHELLEMLLYYIVAQRDTNETAKLLIDSFSSLDGVFRQPSSVLTSVNGVGERVAQFISDIGKLDFEMLTSDNSATYSPCNGYSELGSFFVNRFLNKTEQSVTLMLLDNSGVPIFCKDIYSSDYGAASVKTDKIIELAVNERASAAVIAHNHPFGAAFPTPQDIETNKSVICALENAGISLLEHYIVSGSAYIGFMNRTELSVSPVKTMCENGREESGELLCIFKKILSYNSKLPLSCADLLLEKFSSIRGICEADLYSISKALNGDMQASVYIKLIFAIVSVRKYDKFRFGRKHGERDICDYLKALMLDFSDETVCMISFSEDGKAIACDMVFRGTVNMSEILPRKVLEIANRRAASAVIIAHNHPRGKAVPSEEDIIGTDRLSVLLSSVNIKLINHYVIAGGDSFAVPFKG